MDSLNWSGWENSFSLNGNLPVDELNGPQREKTCFLGVGNNKGTDKQFDQPPLLFSFYKGENSIF